MLDTFVAFFKTAITYNKKQYKVATLINDGCLEMQKNKKKGVWVMYNIIPFHQSHLLADILLEPQRDSEGQAKEKRRKTSKSTTCHFYKLYYYSLYLITHTM